MNATTTTTTTTFSTEAYLASDVKGKAALRSAIAAAITEAVMAGDMETAQTLVATQQTFTTPKASAVEVDWNAKRATLAVTLSAALADVLAGRVTLPEGVEHTFEEVSLSDLPDDVEVDNKVRATMATLSGRKAGRGAVQAWIESVVNDDPTKISDLRKRWTPTTDYPKAAPSAGAIGAAFDRAEAGEGDGVEVGYRVTEVDGKRAAVIF